MLKKVVAGWTAAPGEQWVDRQRRLTAHSMDRSFAYEMIDG